MSSQPGWFNNDVVDNSTSDEEVGGEDESKDGPGGGGLGEFTRRRLSFCTLHTIVIIHTCSQVGCLIFKSGTVRMENMGRRITSMPLKQM